MQLPQLTLLALLLLVSCTPSTITSSVQQKVLSDSEITLLELTPATEVTLDTDKDVVYEKEDVSANVSLAVGFASVPYPVDDYVVVWTEEKSNVLKYGYNITYPNDLTGDAMAKDSQSVTFIVNSKAPLQVLPESLGLGVGYPTGVKTCDRHGFFCDEEWIVFNYDDIKNTLTYEEELLDSDGKPTGEFLSTTVDHSINIDNNIASITFDLSKLGLAQGMTLVLDPTIGLNNVSNQSSVNNNVTCEQYPLCHITPNASSLLLYYPFDVGYDSLNFTYDYTTANRNARSFPLVAGPSYNTTGFIGGAFNFDGINDYLNVTTRDFIGYNAAFSAAVWINTRGSDGTQGIISEDDSANAKRWSLNLRANGTLSYVQYDGGSGATANVMDTILQNNTWYHIVVTRNHTQVAMYLNGTRLTFFNDTPVNATVGSDPSIRIGNQRDQSYFNGTIDEIMIFNRTLTPIEALGIFNGTFPRYAGPPSTQEFQNVSIEQNGSFDTINITYNATILNGSSLGMMLLQYNSSGSNIQNTSMYTLSNGTNQQLTQIPISTSTYNVSIFLNYTSSTSNFYSPVIVNTLLLDVYTTPTAPASNQIAESYIEFTDGGALFP